MGENQYSTEQSVAGVSNPRSHDETSLILGQHERQGFSSFYSRSFWHSTGNLAQAASTSGKDSAFGGLLRWWRGVLKDPGIS